MCRLLGSVSRVPITLDEVLGDERGAFLELAVKHGDGWGQAWSPDGGGLKVRKAPDSARVSSAFAALAAGEPARAALTHLRWATLGLEVSADNTHPFTDGTMAFGHNGSISPPEALDVLIDPGPAARRRGDTDSERFFLALLSRLAGGDEAQAMVSTVADILAGPASAHSLNCMLLTPQALYAVCCYDPSAEEDADYYPLLYRVSADAVVVTSTGWTDSGGWHVLGNGQMLVVDRATLQTSLVAVGTPCTVSAATR